MKVTVTYFINIPLKIGSVHGNRLIILINLVGFIVNKGFEHVVKIKI